MRQWFCEFLKNYIWFLKKLKERFPFMKCVLYNIHFFLCVITDGCSPEEYLWFEFYNKNYLERKKFLTYVRHMILQKKYNSLNVKRVLDDKAMFNEFYREEIGREWLDPDLCEEEVVQNFVKKHNEIFVKPKKGQQGKGAYKYSYNENINNLKEKFSGCILEKCIEQHSLLKEFNPNSVNTLRIGTFCYQGKVNVFAAGLRMATGDTCVDNLHSGGICASVDIGSGKINSTGISGELVRYTKNPYSQKELLNTQIPYWNDVLKLVKSSTKKLSKYSIIGWDVAITESGPVLVEGNHDQGTDAIQACDVKGKYEFIQSIIKKK